MQPTLLPSCRNLKRRSNLRAGDVEHAKDIVDLFVTTKTCRGLMGKELVKVNETGAYYLRERMRLQAEHVSRVHSIYVVDDEED